MCLAVPSRVVRINDQMAEIDVDGVRRQASLLLLEDVCVGDFVIVHAGFAIQKVDTDAARETLQLLRQAVAMSDKTNTGV